MAEPFGAKGASRAQEISAAQVNHLPIVAHFEVRKGVRNLIDGCGTSAYRVDPWVVRQEQHSADWFIMC